MDTSPHSPSDRRSGDSSNYLQDAVNSRCASPSAWRHRLPTSPRATVTPHSHKQAQVLVMHIQLWEQK